MLVQSLYTPRGTRPRRILKCKADSAAMLLLMASINSETPEPRLAGYRSAGSITICFVSKWSESRFLLETVVKMRPKWV